MNNKAALTAIMTNLRKKKKKSAELLAFAEAAIEIAGALRLRHEAAAMTLYGLCATANVSWFNDQEEVVDEDECTIAAFYKTPPAFVLADDVRSFLTDWSADPQPSRREAVIEAMLAEGLNPGRNIRWKKFRDRVRDECKGWIKTGGERKPEPGFSDKQIDRIVNGLRAK